MFSTPFDLRLLMQLAALFGLTMTGGVCLPACGPDADLSIEQRDADADNKVKVVKAVGTAAAQSGLRVKGKFLYDGNASAGIQNGVYANTGVRMEFEFENDPEVAAEFQREIMRRELERQELVQSMVPVKEDGPEITTNATTQ